MDKAHKIGCHSNHPEAKTNFRSIIYITSSSNPENLAKIGPVDVEKIGQTKIVK